MDTGRVDRLTTHHVAIRVTGVEETLIARHGHGLEFQPQTLHLRWLYLGPKERWRLCHVTVAGQNVKRDGMLGQRICRLELFCDGQLDVDAPNWVHQLIELYQPSGQVVVW